MRATVTLEKAILDELVRQTNAKSKAAAVQYAIKDYLRRKKTESIQSMKGQMEFDREADEIRHHDR